MRLRLLEAPAAHQQHAVGVVEAAVVRVAAQALQIVRVRRIGGMAVLFQMQAREQQLLQRGDLLRVRRLLRRFGNALDLLRRGRVVQQ